MVEKRALSSGIVLFLVLLLLSLSRLFVRLIDMQLRWEKDLPFDTAELEEKDSEDLELMKYVAIVVALVGWISIFLFLAGQL